MLLRETTSVNQRKRKERQVPEQCQRTKKVIEQEGDGHTSCNCCTWNSSQKLGKGAVGVRNQKTSGVHPDRNIVKVGQNTEKSPEDLRTLVVAQTLVKDYQMNTAVKKSGVS